MFPIGALTGFRESVCLMFDQTYPHHVDNSQLSRSIDVMVHATREGMGPSDRPFFIWSESRALSGFGTLGYLTKLGRELKIDDKAFTPSVYLYEIDRAQPSQSAQQVMPVQTPVCVFSILNLST